MARRAQGTRHSAGCSVGIAHSPGFDICLLGACSFQVSPYDAPTDGMKNATIGSHTSCESLANLPFGRD
ncbi:unnamed protein product [Somion occarium]|uniref:Uncharacterized protein n=1 Tax=Somion occarium TaxID=3059160 RepID=A0ABP1CPF6_9APHY